MRLAEEQRRWGRGGGGGGGAELNSGVLKPSRRGAPGRGGGGGRGGMGFGGGGGGSLERTGLGGLTAAHSAT